MSILPELNFPCLNIMREKCSYCKEDLLREKFFSKRYEVQFVLCPPPLDLFEFMHILRLNFITLALEHSNSYSRHFIEDKKSLKSSYLFSEMVPP